MRKTKKRGGLAVSQIILLIASTIAISYVLGSQVPLVSAQEKMCVRDPINFLWVTEDGGLTFECISANNCGQGACNPPNCKGTHWFISNSDFCSIFLEIDNTICSSNVVQGMISCTPSEKSTVTPLESATVRPSAVTPTSLGDAPVVPSGIISGLGVLSGVPGLGGTGDTGDTKPTTPTKGFFASPVGIIIKNAGYALAIYGITKFVLDQFGASPELSDAASLAAFGGFLTGKTLLSIFGKDLSFLGLQGALAATVIGLAVAAVIFFATFKKTKFEVASYSCFPWDAPTGGKDCEKCNGEDFPCTEYRCKSLGQACELLNKGTSEELCFWVNRGDVKPPVIQPWEETLTIDYKYVPDSAISPPDRGVRIVKENANGCVEPFTPLRFGVTLDEPAKCKIDPLRKSNFDEMNFFFGGSSTSKLNHTQTMSLPSPEALAAENITLENGGEFELYARCMDANGNSNTANFVFRFCVDEGPDTTPPLIVTTSIFNGMPISFNQTSVDLQVYVNEPSECRWSKIDQSYENMDTQMSCSTNVLEMNAQMLYQCSTTLTGLKDRTDNDFYFRCKDQPHLAGTDRENDRNTNTESFKFTLVGTRPLVIDSTEPNETIKDSTDIIKVTLEAKTSAGFSEGEAICSFSDTGEEDSFIEFFETGTNQHSQDLFLSEGSYTYHIRCVDLGGNADNKIISFDVESDSDAPVIVRIFHEENKLKIITDEEASCVYDNVDCSYLFEDGIKMSTLDDETHSIDWDPEKNFYIKCEDKFGNRPFPNQCSIIARPFQI